MSGIFLEVFWKITKRVSIFGGPTKIQTEYPLIINRKALMLEADWLCTNTNGRSQFYLLTCLFHGAEFLRNSLVLQLVKKFPAFYGTRKFITVLTSAHQLSLS
jgi:hypothetical protein